MLRICRSPVGMYSKSHCTILGVSVGFSGAGSIGVRGGVGKCLSFR